MVQGTTQDFFNATDYFLDRNIRQGRGHTVAVYTEFRNYTYNDIQKMTNKTANALRELGVRVGDRLLILLLDVPQFYAVFWGAIRIGAVPIPVNTMLTAEEYEYFLNDSRAKLLVMSEQLIPIIRQIKGNLPYLRDLIVISETEGVYIPFRQKYRHAPSDINTEFTTKDDVGFWLYSSGSTGLPKGAIHSHYDMVAATEGFGRGVLGLTEHDIIFSAAPLFHAYGLGNACYLPFGVGASVILNSDVPRPEKVLDLIERFRPTVFFDIPTNYGEMLDYLEKQDKQKGTRPDPQDAHEFSSVRVCISAGEALPPELYHRWKARFGLDILDGIGTSELLHIFICNRPGDVRPGSSGKPVPGYELKLIDEGGQEVPKGRIGTLLVKGGSAAQQYWRGREKTLSTMQGEWINTGDKYYEDADGYFWCAGRADDMLKVGDIWVSPVEVENCLMKHPAVREVAVVGRADEKSLIKPKAFVVLREGQGPTAELENEIRQWALDRVGKVKYPQWVEFVRNLPKGATGKIQRFKLRGEK
jgi:4-hydroxybenzoate-CoA ligase